MVVDPVWVVVLEVPVPGDGFPEVVGELAVVGWGEGVGLGEGVGRAAVDEAEVVVVPFGLEKGLEKGVEIVGKKGRVMEGGAYQMGQKKANLLRTVTSLGNCCARFWRRDRESQSRFEKSQRLKCTQGSVTLWAAQCALSNVR